MLITSSFKDDVDFVINHLKKIFLTKLLWNLNYFLGMEIKRIDKGMFIS
jgi:hypothetical protein